MCDTSEPINTNIYARIYFNIDEKYYSHIVIDKDIHIDIHIGIADIGTPFILLLR